MFGFSPSDIWELLKQAQKLARTYRHAGEELKDFKDSLGEWGSCLESLERTLDLANKPTCRSFESFRVTVKEGYKILARYEDLLKSSSGSPQQTVKKVSKAASYRMNEPTIKDLISRAQRHISTIHLYTTQVQL